jgi:hypothetical protein
MSWWKRRKLDRIAGEQRRANDWRERAEAAERLLAERERDLSNEVGNLLFACGMNTAHDYDGVEDFEDALSYLRAVANGRWKSDEADFAIAGFRGGWKSGDRPRKR